MASSHIREYRIWGRIEYGEDDGGLGAFLFGTKVLDYFRRSYDGVGREGYIFHCKKWVSRSVVSLLPIMTEYEPINNLSISTFFFTAHL